MRPYDFIPFSKKNRRDIIFEKLEELIESGHWKPGEQIMTEQELSRRFNAGRTTVRAALNRLKSSGLVASTPGKGTFVKYPPAPNPAMFSSKLPESLTRDELLEVMDFRFCVEPAIAALASQHATKSEISELVALTHRLKDNPMEVSEFYAETDLAFHTMLAEVSRNALFLASMRTAKPFMMKQHILTSSVPEMRPLGPRYHLQIVEALEEHLPRKAEAIMRAHIDETYHYIKKMLI